MTDLSSKIKLYLMVMSPILIFVYVEFLKKQSSSDGIYFGDLFLIKTNSKKIK